MIRFSIVFCIALLAWFYVFPQQEGIDPTPRPKTCVTENLCPRTTIFHETTFRADGLGFNWNSINLDQILVCREKYLVSFRIGIIYYAFSKLHSAGLVSDINLMLGGGPLMFETGAGLNYHYIYTNYNKITGKFPDNLSYLAATGRLGLRYQKQHSIFFRAGYTPMYSLINNKEITIVNNKGKEIICDQNFYSMFSGGFGYTF